MTPLEKQIAIAKEDGWEDIYTEIKPAITYLWGWPRYDKQLAEEKDIVPDYLNSHNALLPVLDKMSEEEWDRFVYLAMEKWKDEKPTVKREAFIRWLLTQPPSVLADIYLKVKGYEI